LEPRDVTNNEYNNDYAQTTENNIEDEDNNKGRIITLYQTGEDNGKNE